VTDMRAPATDLPIVLQGVSYRVRDTVILDRVSLSLAAGAPTVLIGPNGGGKTTLMRLAMGLVEPNSGRWGCGDHTG
jgi:tungstate transport system ATP-binding protein